MGLTLAQWHPRKVSERVKIQIKPLGTKQVRGREEGKSGKACLKGWPLTETQHLHKKVLGFWGKVVGTGLMFSKVAYEGSGEAARVSWEASPLQRPQRPRWRHAAAWGPGSGRKAGESPSGLQ